MHRNPAMLYFFALNKAKTIQFYDNSPIIEIGITPRMSGILYHFINKFTHKYNADIYLKLSDTPDKSGVISE